MKINPELEEKINRAARTYKQDPEQILNSALTIGLETLTFSYKDLKIFESLINKTLSGKC